MIPVRFIALAVAIGAAAVAVPKFAPGFLSVAIRQGAEEQAVPASRGTTAEEQKARIRPPAGRRTTIAAAGDGQYYADAQINGRAIGVVVDTGATTVALTAESARRLGIVPPRSEFTVPISTANGVTAGARVVLSEIRLGTIAIRSVDAIVLPEGALEVNLLGMSFLSRLTRFESGGGQLVLIE